MKRTKPFQPGAGIAARALAGAALCLLCGCTTGSNDFSNILDNGGGTGNASVSITSYTPGVASFTLKDTGSQNFLVSATGSGTLAYAWKLDGVTVGSNSPAFTLDATQYSVGNKVLKLVVSDSAGSATQEWNVKINGSPSIGSSTPAQTTALLRHDSTLDYSVAVTDPNGDTLTYVWKLDGQEGVLGSSTASASWTPSTVDVGTHTVSVDIYDGPASDAGTYKITRAWTTYVNNFADACNDMENNSSTNKTCVYVGIPGIGDGSNPLTSPSDFYIRPAALAMRDDGNQFIADDFNHVVWFWNKNTSPSLSVLGVTVPVNTMKVVAGVGLGSSGNSASGKALRTFLNSPHGILWDGTYLYISNYGNATVVRVDGNGDLTTVVSSGCSQPRGLAKIADTLYVACYNSNIIMQVDLTTLTTSTFAGTGSAANPSNMNESTPTDATNGKLNHPYGLVADEANGLLYAGEYSGCRVHLYNLSGADKYLYGTYKISNGKQRIIAGAAGSACASANADGEPVDITGSANAGVGNVRLLSLDTDGRLLIGNDQDQIGVLNFDSTDATVLGVTVPGYSLTYVIGSGTAGYLGEGQTAPLTRTNNPFQAAEDPLTGDYYFADYSNNRYRRVRALDNKVELIAGNGNQRGQTNAGQGTIEVGQEKMNQIRGLAYDKISGEIFVSDSANNRIRVISRYGVASQAVGTGASGSGAEEDEYPTNVTMNSPRSLALVGATSTFGGHLVWADYGNHRIRIYNRASTTQSLFGVSVGAGKVATIGGDGTAGNATSGTALQAAFNNPYGVTSDGTNLYVADYGNHCIKKIDATGALSVVAGTCGTAGNVNGAAGVGRMNHPSGIDYYSNNGQTGLLIADQGNTRLKYYAISGSSLIFGGATSVGDANNIACGGSFHSENINASLTPCSGVYDVTAVGGKVCFANYTYHNVRCILSTGEISTVLGAVQGKDSSTTLYFPGTSLSAATFDPLNPNYTAQNGVLSFFLPSPVAEPSYTTSFGVVAYPMAVRALDDNTLLVGEYNLGLIRKVKLP